MQIKYYSDFGSTGLRVCARGIGSHTILNKKLLKAYMAGKDLPKTVGVTPRFMKKLRAEMASANVVKYCPCCGQSIDP